ncbi:hypothetical protein FK178_12545 [Antarcticibacterium arcticum]|uniref:Uncharacterized protein n=1 Tax=Antarcticibacterium arcticum TaxID=2585771 RepID=A0A5B8YLR2_9FLAO|nr:DUF6168 family protein [Antarcticibacterium arcticum]QED38491.1 hypothetical protein FK178_12545 [Antarcticibacterium arcticum]
MKQQLLNFSYRLLPFTIILFLIQYLISAFLLEDMVLYYPVFAIYLFHFLATLIIYFILILIYNNFQDKTGFAFMGASLLKMLAAVLFLLPMLLSNSGNPFANLLSFFIPYFLFLVFETFYAVKLINAK